MLIKRSLFGIIAVSMLFAATSAWADSISIANASFETLPSGGLPYSCGGTCAYSVVEGIPGWHTSGQSGQWIIGGFLGNAVAIDGNVVAYSDSGSIWQDVASAVAGDTYTLQVDVYHRTDRATAGGNVQLEIGGVVVAGAPRVDAGAGTWNNWTLHYSALAPDAGKTMAILLSTSGGNQFVFDNVRLNSSTSTSEVPEPASLLLFGTGLAGLLKRRLYRKSSQQIN